MSVSRVLFSSNSDEWSTPQGLFDELDKEFHFTLDPCGTAENAKCVNYYSPQEPADPGENRHKVLSRLYLRES